MYFHPSARSARSGAQPKWRLPYRLSAYDSLAGIAPPPRICAARETPLVGTAGRPSSSRIVGIRSTLRNWPRTRAPAGSLPGQRISSGTRSVES